MFSYALTRRQKEILKFLSERHARTGVIPSIREIQERFKFASSNAVAQHLGALEKKGHIIRERGKARSIRFPKNPEAPIKLAAGGRTGRIQDEANGQITLASFEEDSDEKRMDHTNWFETSSALNAKLEFLGAAALDERTRLIRGDAMEILAALPKESIHAIVTDPPYGLIEYEGENHAKLREGRGGIWRIPPKLDGVERSPLPRFTVLTSKDRERLFHFFLEFGKHAGRVLRPGGHLILASNPLLSTLTFSALAESGLEKRGEVIRLVSTLRGGDRPKGAEDEFSGVTVMPRSCWEPWGLFRKELSETTVAENLRKHEVGGLRRLSSAEPFRDVVDCPPARGRERELAPHPSLKPQRLMRYLVRASLPLGKGVILDPFSGSGSTLAAASALGYASIGIERDGEYAELAAKAFAGLKRLAISP